MTQDVIAAHLRRLGSLRFPPADFQGHVDVLTDCAEPDLDAAVTRALRGRVEFPTPAELLAEVRAVQGERLAAAVVDEHARTVPLDVPVTIHVPQAERDFVITHEHVYHCEHCQDAGFEEFACGAPAETRQPWLQARPCDRGGAHGSHTWVRYCLCYKSNPVVQARLASGRR